MSDAVGSKNTCKTFSTKFFDWRIQSKKSSFSTGSVSRNFQSKKVESKKPFFDCVRKPDSGFSQKRPFTTGSLGHFLCSRIPPVENGPFRLDFFSTGFFWSFLSSVESILWFCALPRGGWCEGVLLYSSRNRLAALCFALSPRATARRTIVPASWWLRA